MAAGKLGDDGVRRSSEGRLGEGRPGDCGRGVWDAVCSDKRFSGCERRCASLFVCRAFLGVPPADVWPGGCCVFCMLAVSSRVATRIREVVDNNFGS